VQLATLSFNKSFLANSPLLCFVYKAIWSQIFQISNAIWDAIKNKLSSSSWHWGPFKVCIEMQTSCLNRTRSFTLPFVMLLVLKSHVCKNLNWHLYIVSSMDSICDYYGFYLCRQVRCQPFRWAYGAIMLNHSSMFCCRGGHMPMYLLSEKRSLAFIFEIGLWIFG